MVRSRIDMKGQNKELGRSLSCSDLRFLPKLRNCDTNSGAGAGANAGSSNLHMKIAAKETSSELVWSPRNGLSLRCTDCSFTNKRKLVSPFIGLGPNHKVITQRTTSHEAEFNVNLQIRTADMSGRTGDGADQDCWPSNEMDKPTTGAGGLKVDKHNGGSIGAAEETETGERNSRRLLDDPRAMGEKSLPMSTNQSWKIENAMNPGHSFKNGAETCGESAVLGRKEDGDRMKKANCLNVSGVEHLESTAENDLPTPAGPAHKISAREWGETDVENAGPPRHPLMDNGPHIYCGKGKGKEKAISDGSLDRRTLKDGDDNESFASVESCNTAGMLSMGKKRSNIEQQLIEGSKRVKTQFQESPVSVSRLKRDSSFMNWISNMTKGFWKANEEEKSPPSAHQLDRVPDQDFGICSQKEDNRRRNTGFQSIFQSIYCPKSKIQEAVAELSNEPRDASATRLSSLRETPNFITNQNSTSLSDNEIGPEAEPILSSGKLASSESNKAVSCKSQHSCSDEISMDKRVTVSFSPLGTSKLIEDQKTDAKVDGKATQTFPSRNDGLGSLWITQFSPRSFSLRNKDYGDGCTGEAVECPREWRERISSVDLKDGKDSTSIVVKTTTDNDKDFGTINLQKTTVENNASVGAIHCYDDSTVIHDLNTASSSPRMKSLEAMACLLARRLDAIKHITPSDLSERAAKCPNAPQRRSRIGRTNITNPERTPTDDAQKFIEKNRVKEHASSSPSPSGLKLPPFHDSVDKQVSDAPEGIFNAVRVLRLSRTDILKWMTSNSKVSPLHLEGFFLRLKVGKWEETLGLGGTGYYVACITGGSEEESSARDSNNSISVTVGGMACLVESQNISNHDFLEVELKAWWCTTARSGGGLPSEKEVRRKLLRRKMLGF